MASADIRPVVDKAGRLWSIDALRGFDMFWIVGGEEVVHRFFEWTKWPGHEVVSEQLEHVEWDGFHFEDLIFPLFLFLVGAVLPFSLGKLTEPGAPRTAAYGRILRRTLLLYVLGLLYYGRHGVLEFAFNDQRYFGVLQRIAICYGIAAFITLLVRVPGQAVILVAILAGYWALMTKVAVPGGTAGDLTPQGNLSGHVDRWIRDNIGGKIWTRYYDNEGLLSTLPAVATTLLGALAGHWLRTARGALTKTIGLAMAGAVCLVLGLFWAGYIPGLDSAWVFPCIKNLWTSSYVLIAGGWSLLLLALFYGIIDGLGWRSWAFFFVVIGANAITIYFAHKVVNFHEISAYFFGGLGRWSERHGGDPNVVLALGVLIIEWLLLYVLYRHRVFLRV
jgi:predicted acyltransferase